TRFSRDWSSDVCSSDLAEPGRPGGRGVSEAHAESQRDAVITGDTAPGWSGGKAVLYGSLVGGVVALDQLTKYVVQQTLVLYHPSSEERRVGEDSQRSA